MSVSKSLDDFLTKIEVGKRTVLDVAKDGRSITVEQRQLLPEEPRPPRRMESPPRAHEFLSAGSFGDYLARFGTPHTVVFVDLAGETVYAVLNENAEDGFQVVSMKPQIHPLWEPWRALAGRRIPVTQFAQFVAENRRAIMRPDGRELAMLLSQIRASVSLELHQGRGKNAVNGIRITTQIQGERGVDVIELPDTVGLVVPLYVDTEPEDVELDLCIEADQHGAISVLVTSGTVAEARVDAFNQMVNKIREKTGKLGCIVGFGKPKHGQWTYLDELETEPHR